MKIGILRETKIPPDRRVALTPLQCRALKERFPHTEVIVQPSEARAYSDNEYMQAGIRIADSMTDCDILFGVKEVDKKSIIPGKTYLFFSHTAKLQPHNKPLLQALVRNRVTLIDYEYLTTDDRVRLVAFGRWAGIVGAYKGLNAFGIRNSYYRFKYAWQCRDYSEMISCLRSLSEYDLKIVMTGGGRVAGGAMEILDQAGILKVSPEEFLKMEFRQSVYCQLDPVHYVKHKSGKEFDFNHFVKNPAEYESIFLPYTRVANMMLACHFWDPGSPSFFTPEDAGREDFKIKVVADISCDVPGPIPTTLRASTIEQPFYGYLPGSGMECDPFDPSGITVMAVDNLPGELPRNASEDFGEKLLTRVVPLLLSEKAHPVITRATITDNGSLTPAFAYLDKWLNS